MKVLMASAEMSPVARVGGMAEAVAGLVRQLRADGVEVDVVLPDYGGVELAEEQTLTLDVPEWAEPAVARCGQLEGVGPLTLVDVPGMAKPHPYNDESGLAFEDNDRRFFAFCAAVADLVDRTEPDVVHLNDWHTAATLGFLETPPPSMLSVHTLGYQGIAGPEWMGRLKRGAELFEWYGDTNPLLGGLQLADRVVTVSPNYASEILHEPHGMGLHEHLVALGSRLVGIINGIDTGEWNPTADPHLPAAFSVENLRGKSTNRAALVEAFGLGTDGPSQPVIGMVTRLVEQKGIDLVLDLARFLEGVPARLAILGSGDAHLADALGELAERQPDRVGFIGRYDPGLAHLVFAGSDLLLMPSRFEPCGLAQMQAMAYGTMPVVTAVGGLVDTVIDADHDPERGTGFVSPSADAAGVVDAIHRANRAWLSTRRRSAIRARGMAIDWSWSGPAADYRRIYDEIA
jgi:starch synthase